MVALCGESQHQLQHELLVELTLPLPIRETQRRGFSSVIFASIQGANYKGTHPRQMAHGMTLYTFLPRIAISTPRKLSKENAGYGEL